MVLVHFLCHVLGFDYGLPYGHFSWYDAWSGFGSDLGEASVAGTVMQHLKVTRQHHREHMSMLSSGAPKAEGRR